MSFPASFNDVHSDEHVIVTNDNVTLVSSDNSSPNSSHTRSSHFVDPMSSSPSSISITPLSTFHPNAFAYSPPCSSPHIDSPQMHHLSELTPVLRRSQREHKTPTYLKDYVHNVCNPATYSFSLNTLFSNHHHIARESLILSSQALVSTICNDNEPSSFEEVVVSSARQAAIVKEFTAFYANNTWNMSRPKIH